MRRISREVFSVSSSPSNAMRPPAMRPAGGSRPTIERQVVVLPQPDSPMRPRVSPSFRVKLMPSTALTTRVPPKEVKCVRRSVTSRSGVMGCWTLSGKPSQIPLLRVEADAQPVTEQLRCQHDQQNAKTGEDREPPVADHQH